MNAARTHQKFDKAGMSNSQAKREAARSQANGEELTERMAQAIQQDGTSVRPHALFAGDD